MTPDNEKLDPEVAALLGLDTNTPKKEPEKSKPIQKTPPKEKKTEEPLKAEEPNKEDNNAKEQPVKRKDKGRKISKLKINYTNKLSSSDKEYVKAVIKDEPQEIIDAVLKTKKLFENPPDPKDRFTYRERLATAYWNFVRVLLQKSHQQNLCLEKRLALRLNLLDRTYLKEEQLKVIENIDLDYDASDPIFYVDEFIGNIIKGEINPSEMDETKISTKKGNSLLKEKMEKRRGQKDAEFQVIRNKMEQIQEAETHLSDIVKTILQRQYLTSIEEEQIYEPYDQAQRQAINELPEIARNLARQDKALESSIRIIEGLNEDIEQLQSNLSDEEDDFVDSEMIENEFMAIKQMAKMCVGPRGNHFPILHESYFLPDATQIATKENIQKIIEEIEYLDPGLFTRYYKGEESRIVPFIIVVPSYGEQGICWEPFDRHNRATGRGRIAIPMYPKSLKLAILYAFGDLRWQIAKERAQHRWMEEGLTGYYYEYYSNEQLKGEIKNYFVEDYSQWILNESNAIQKLNKDVRQTFWRYMPFPQEVKDKLKNRGYYYSELYKKDQNIARSDGY